MSQVRFSTADFDPRLHAVREDAVEAPLASRFPGREALGGREAEVISGSCPLHRSPRADAPLDSELCFGERVTVFEESGGWAWVKNQRDSYVGYCPSDMLSTLLGSPTDRVSVLRTYLYSHPDIKSPVVDVLHLNSQLCVVGREGDFSELHRRRGWVYAPHLSPLGAHPKDPLRVAMCFYGLPYRWGGKSSVGLDCSALIQLSLQTCGFECPRDSDQQEGVVGRPVGVDQVISGDIVYWPGHVGIALNERDILHATAHSMSVCIEPIGDVTLRVLAEQAEEPEESRRTITAVRRLPSPAAGGFSDEEYYSAARLLTLGPVDF